MHWPDRSHSLPFANACSSSRSSSGSGSSSNEGSSRGGSSSSSSGSSSSCSSSSCSSNTRCINGNAPASGLPLAWLSSPGLCYWYAQATFSVAAAACGLWCRRLGWGPRSARTGTCSAPVRSTRAAAFSDTQRRALCLAAPNPQLLSWVRKRLGEGERELAGAALYFEGKLLEDVEGVEPGQGSKSNAAFLASFAEHLRSREAAVIALPMKDVPPHIPNGMVLGAVLPREEANMALVTRPGMDAARSLALLPEGSVLQVPSPQKRLQIQAYHPHLVVCAGVRNLQARLRLLHLGEFDACVAGVAELRRSGFTEEAGDWRPLPYREVMPAFGQGAVGLFYKQGDFIKDFIKQRDDAAARTCIESERHLCRHMGLYGKAATAGGVAHLLPDGRLHLQSILAQPSGDGATAAFAERTGRSEESKKMAREMAEELVSKVSEEGAAPIRVAAKREQPSKQQEPLPPILGAEERMPVELVGSTSFERYAGRVCMVLPSIGGVLLDINCAVPTRCFHERVDGGPPLALGSEVEVHCLRHCPDDHLWTLQHAPPPLLGRGQSGRRLLLTELRQGDGPFRAVVISCTIYGTLVDFNCEVPGRLACTRAHAIGSEMTVYCYEVFPDLMTCTMVALVPPFWKLEPLMRLEDLDATGRIAYRGIVQRVWGRRAWVDFHCEVQGTIKAHSIDEDLWPDGLVVGDQVDVYVQSCIPEGQLVPLSMFPQTAASL